MAPPSRAIESARDTDPPPIAIPPSESTCVFSPIAIALAVSARACKPIATALLPFATAWFSSESAPPIAIEPEA